MSRPVVPKDSALVAQLHEISKAKPKLIKSSTYPAPADASITVRSWKMDEFKYYDIPSPFPTLARGIFTVDLPKAHKSDPQEYRIVARGYDKFFNIGEVPWTTWEALEAHTAAPYTLSLKSNGCIIFIAAISLTKLLITSKHSIGPIAGHKMSHAQAGEGWLRKYFAQKGKTEEQLAAQLWENNWTAIAELCDDAFEEHVLGYPADQTGLHLHGLNESTTAFKTLPQAQVDAFAAEWGFIQTASTVLQKIADVRAFTDAVGAAGAWNGVPVEGFVVRTHVASTPGAAPYAPGATLFFKVKFDEPYMMYRDWREVTKTLLRLHAKGGMREAALPKGKMRRAETRAYVRWVIGEIARDDGAFEEYNKGKGIIATRERFLAHLATPKGATLLAAAKEGDLPAAPGPSPAADVPFGKTIIVPVAIPGCGKTAVSVALAHIFGFAHTQSDDVRAKKPAPLFIKDVTALLRTHDVVIADKNNHLRQHRAALRAATVGRVPPVRLLALNWALDGGVPAATTHRVCAARVAQRGANHQTLRAGAHEDAIWRFISGTEALAPGEVDAIVEMDVQEGLEDAVARAVAGCVRVLGLRAPAPEEVAEGVARARGYAAAGKAKETEAQPQHEETPKKTKKGPRYYALMPEVDLVSVLGGPIAQGDRAVQKFWAHLTTAQRVARRPHVTLVHSKSLGQEPGAEVLWARCAALTGAAPLLRCALGHVVWNERVMAVTVDDLQVVRDSGQAGAEFVAQLPQDVRDRLHVTVGTRDPEIVPVEAKTMVEEWRAGKVTDIKSMKLDGVTADGRVQGMFS
ncbi:RNA ligase-domain-containing protein [Mycena sp. CBHHK59/15]|nr:RNA ligase-domain-containing protein [Mycena sp. CBHHK59/15]